MEDRARLAALTEILAFAESDDPSLTLEAIEKWPPTAREWVNRSGLLKESEIASTVVCDACDLDHAEEVLTVPGEETLPARHFIVCPDAGRVPVPAERLRRLAVDLDRFVSMLGEASGAAGGVLTTIPGRLWRIGRLRLGGEVRTLFVARDISWDDGPRLLADPMLTSESQPVLLTLRGGVPVAGMAILNLREALVLTDDGLVFDRLALGAFQTRGRTPTRKDFATFPTPSGATWDDVWIAIGEFEVRVRVRSVEKTLKYDAIGFIDGRTGKQPDAKWSLLQKLGLRLGVLSEDDRNLGQSVKGSLKQNVSAIRKRVRDLFVTIDGDPILFHDDRTYRSRFHIGPEEPFVLGPLRGFGWSDVTIAEGQNASELDVIVRGDVHRLPLCFVGLGDLSGKANAGGRRLEQLFRDGGEIQELPTDRGMQELGNSLCVLLGLQESAFQFDPGSGRLADTEPGRWLPNFKVVPRRRSSTTEASL